MLFTRLSCSTDRRGACLVPGLPSRLQKRASLRISAKSPMHLLRREATLPCSQLFGCVSRGFSLFGAEQQCLILPDVLDSEAVGRQAEVLRECATVKICVVVEERSGAALVLQHLSGVNGHRHLLRDKR